MLTRLLVGLALALGLAAPAAAAPARPVAKPPMLSIAGPSVVLGTESAGTGNAEGWTAFARGNLGLNPNKNFPVRRLGYDQAGNLGWTTDYFTVTQLLRNVVNGTSDGSEGLRADRLYALSDYVLKTDVIAGVVNASTIAAPAPLCNFTMTTRTVVSSSILVEAVCFHRNGRNGQQVPLVVFSASDGTSTNTCNATTMATSTLLAGQTVGDKWAVPVYSCTLPLTTAAGGANNLADNHIVTVNGKAYPYIGDASSIADSSASAVVQDWSPRYFYRDTTHAAAPVIAYVCATTTSCPGQTTGTAGITLGRWDSAVQAAMDTPFATIQNALDGVTTATGLNNNSRTGGKLDGLIIRVGGGTYTIGTATTARVQAAATITVTRDPLVARAASTPAVLTLGGNATYKVTTGLVAPVTTAAILVKDIAVTRTAGAAFNGSTPYVCDWTFQDVDLNLGAFVSSLQTSLGTLQFFGVNITNAAADDGSSLAPSGNNNLRMVRGVAVGGTSSFALEAKLVLGSTLTNETASYIAARPGDRSIIAFNRFYDNNGNAQDTINFSGQTATFGIAVVQNLFEFNYATPTSATGMGLSRDTQGASLYNLLYSYNTQANWGTTAGRINAFYDETTGTYRLYRLQSWTGNISSMVFTKGDRFLKWAASATTAEAQLHTGNWAILYGAGNRYSLTRFCDNGCIGGNRMWAYPGLGSVVGTSNTADTIDPKFVDYKSTTWDGTQLVQGAGGGDYHLNSNSPCKGRVPTSSLPVGLDGSARPKTGDSCGAYP